MRKLKAATSSRHRAKDLVATGAILRAALGSCVVPSEKAVADLASSDSTARTPSQCQLRIVDGVVMIHRFVLSPGCLFRVADQQCSRTDHKILVNSCLIILCTCGTMPRPGKTFERTSSSTVNGSVPALSSSRWVRWLGSSLPPFAVSVHAPLPSTRWLGGRPLSEAQPFRPPVSVIGLDYAV